MFSYKIFQSFHTEFSRSSDRYVNHRHFGQNSYSTTRPRAIAWKRSRKLFDPWKASLIDTVATFQPATCNLDTRAIVSAEPRATKKRESRENVDGKRKEGKKCVLWVRLPLCCRHCCSRIRLRETKRASERLRRAIPWNGMERNGMARVLQNISFHRISAAAALHKPRITRVQRLVYAIATLLCLFVVSFVLDAFYAFHLHVRVADCDQTDRDHRLRSGLFSSIILFVLRGNGAV